MLHNQRDVDTVPGDGIADRGVSGVLGEFREMVQIEVLYF
jgi:hypothetical protein